MQLCFSTKTHGERMFAACSVVHHRAKAHHLNSYMHSIQLGHDAGMLMRIDHLTRAFVVCT